MQMYAKRGEREEIVLLGLIIALDYKTTWPPTPKCFLPASVNMGSLSLAS